MMKHEQIMKDHQEIKAWLRDRPFNTQRHFAINLVDFCKSVKVTPEEWRRMDKFKARDLLWKYVEPLKVKGNSRAMLTVNAAKSWYRNLNGEVLPLDSAKGGKHAIKRIRKKATFEHIPNKEEVYRIIDMAGNLRDRAILLTLFQSGIRSNALRRLTYGMVADQLNQDIFTLKITSDVDEKLRGTDIPFYYTFINGEAAISLRQHCEKSHKRSKPGTPLFYTKQSYKPLSQFWLWKIMHKCTSRAGFDPKTMWPHSLRKAFRKIVRQADIDDDDKEQLMGHAIQGSREAYFDRHEVELIKAAYEKCNFAREVPRSEVTKLRQQLEDKTTQMQGLEKRIELLEEFIKKAVKPS